MKKSSLLQSKHKFNWLFAPIIFVLTIVPLIVRLAVVEIDYQTLEFYSSSTQTDLYAQYKALFLFIGAIAMVVIATIMFKKIFEKKDKQTWIYLIASGVFILFTFLSALFAENQEVAFKGFYSQAEGFITIMCYMIVFLYTIFAFLETEDYRYIVFPLMVVVAINAFMGILQYTGNDLLNFEIGKNLMIPSKYHEAFASVEYLFKDGKMYGTISHYNYMGSFTAMMIPLFTILTIVEKQLKSRILFGITALLSCMLLFGSTARSGIIGMVGIVVFAIIVFGKQLISHWKISGSVIAAVVLVIIGLSVVTKGAIFERLPALVEDSLSIFSNSKAIDFKDELPIRDIRFKDKSLLLTAQTDVLEVTIHNNELSFKDSKNDTVNYVQEKDTYTIQNKAFEGFQFTMGIKSKKSTAIDLVYLTYQNNALFYFNISDTNEFHLANPYTFKDIELDYPEQIGFKGKEKMGSARGYIWSRTLPLIKDNLVIGCGPDNYVFEFPQYDFLGKLYSYGTTNTIISKPHNLYLQILINNGGIAFLAFITIIVTYILDCLKLYALKKQISKEMGIGIAVFLSIIGYLFAGLFNDSLNLIAPIFWILLGFGVAINTINRKKLI